MDYSTSIYSKQNPKIREILDQAGNPAKVLCVAMDYAKVKHVVLLCNGFGDMLRKPFAVENSSSGLKELLGAVEQTCAHRGIKKSHVFFGGEDDPPYVENFLHQLTQRHYLVVRVNAWEAKKQRDNNQASTDQIDVRAVAKTMLHKAAYCDQDQSQAVEALRELSRTRSAFVARATQHKLQIHHYVSRLLPNYLIEEHSGIAGFSRASLALMAENFSARHIARRRHSQLVHFLEGCGHPQAQVGASKLKALAGQALPAAPQRELCWQTSLSEYVLQFQSLNQSIQTLEKQLAHYLAQTPGVLLTSISGLGVVLAAGILSELGDPDLWTAVRNLCSYCGVVPGVIQTGGPDKPARTTTVRRRCNRRAKNWIVQAATKMGECGPPELKAAYQKLKDEGQHAEYVMAKRLLRIIKDLLRRRTVYRPKALLAPDTPPPVLSNYYLELWQRLLPKWKGLIPYTQLVDPRFALGQWRNMIQDVYKISLPLPQARSGKKS
jgi:transposase